MCKRFQKPFVLMRSAGLSSLALPGMSSFVSEFMVLAGAWSREPWVGAVAVLGTVLAAVYILLMYQRVMTGPKPTFAEGEAPPDLSWREKVVVAPIIASFLWFFGLGYGARVLTPLFAKPMAWRVLDALIALVMWSIAAKLGVWLAEKG